MAARLAINIRGLGEIDGPVLRQVADYFFDFPAMLLGSILELLAEVEYVQLITTGKTLNSVIPQVPHFSSVYGGLGDYLGTIELNEHEEVAIAVLNELRGKPVKRDTLINQLAAPMPVFNRVEYIAADGGLLIPKRARGQDILVSPFYFADSLDALANHAAAGGSKSVGRLLELLKKSQGWPLSLILARKEINGYKLNDTELQLLGELVSDGVLRPPSLKNTKTNTQEHFIFTPRPGNQQMDGAKREIYERTMAIVAAVRKGQLMPSTYRIRYPTAILNKLKQYKRIGASTESAHQYANLVTLQVGRLKPTDKPGWFEFELIDTPENLHAVDGAIALFEAGDAVAGGVSEDARIALQRDESYIQSILGATALRATERPALSEEAKAEMDQMLLFL